MANMTFGVNLIPHNNAPTGSNNYSLGNSNYRWKIYANTINDLSIDNYINPSVMTGATENANGVAGLVPAPTSADAGKFLRGDGTWGSAAGVNVPVQDVQINDVSVLSNGVANVPKSAIGVLGVVKPNYMGISVNGNGELYVIDASTADIKAGNVGYNPIVSSHQHESTFYGLAKAAGADMASSNNSVGTYTDEAKTAIRSMLGVQNFNPQSIAIVANGDTHAAITSGQYVYVQNHSTFTEGLYAASSAIDANEALSASNLTAVGSGGLNALLGIIPEQLIHMGTETDYPLSTTITGYQTGITLMHAGSSTSYPYRYGNVVTIRVESTGMQFAFNYTPDDYKLRTVVQGAWSDWKDIKDFSVITGLQKAIGIVVDGNKAASTAAIGQFVILKNTTISGKADGLYTAAKAIPANTAIDNTYLTAVSNGGLNNLPVLLVDCGTISSLPKTVSNANITNDMVVLRSTLGTPSAQLSDWTVTTANGSLTISGTINGSTALTLYLMKSR